MIQITASHLADVLTQKIFRGWLTADAETTVDAVLAAVPCWRDADERARRAFRAELLLEIEARLAVQESVVIFNHITFLN